MVSARISNHVKLKVVTILEVNTALANFYYISDRSPVSHMEFVVDITDLAIERFDCDLNAS